MKTKVENKIRELVPDELNGEICVECNGYGEYSDHAPMSTHHPEDGSCLECPVQIQCENCQGDGFVNKPSIHLEHVLRAIAIADMVRRVCVDELGNVLVYNNKSKIIDDPCHYNLSLPFSEQSDELYKFLGGILL